jgi:hypothetical protein
VRKDGLCDRAKVQTFGPFHTSGEQNGKDKLQRLGRDETSMKNMHYFRHGTSKTLVMLAFWGAPGLTTFANWASFHADIKHALR